MKKVFAVIVNYHEKKKVLTLLQNLAALKDKKRISIIVVDNNSSDGTVTIIKKKFPKIILMTNKENLGFAKAVNKAVRLALYKKADYIWLINPDTKIPKDFLTEILRTKADIFGPVIKYNKNNKYIYDLGGLVNWRLGRTYHKEVGEYPLRFSGEPEGRLQNQKRNGFWTSQNDDVRKTDYLSGCCLLIKKEVFEKIGLFDERFFLYFEDADFCTRAKREGFNISQNPKVVITHYLKGQEKGGYKPFFNIYHNLRSNLLFIFKYQRGFGLITSLVYFFLLSGKVILNEVKMIARL